jgi:hypothetical protein
MNKNGNNTDNDIWNNIKCPYCFRTFRHDEVHFRIAEDTCEHARSRNNGAEGNVFARFERREELDQKYSEVWGKFRGGEPSAAVKELFYIPWVNDNNKDTMIEGDYIRDDEGFVEKIRDKCNRAFSSIRICPHCHNKLPLHYGKNPQKFISIMGVSASGKTVFIKQLLSKIGKDGQDGILGHVGGSRVSITFPDDDKDELEANKPLPDATITLSFKIPYFVTMSFEKKTYDFVIYDIAGEILVNLANEDIDRFKFFGGYIEKSDAIIMLIDPIQLVDNPAPRYSASVMMQTLYKVFGNQQLKIPTAITISKSDLLLSNELIKNSLNPNGEYFNDNSSITKNIAWNGEKRYFYIDEYAKLKGQLDILYQKKADTFLQGVDQGIDEKKKGFFAVSSLMDGVDRKLKFELYPKNLWSSEILDRYIEKFKILSNKLKYIRDFIKSHEANSEIDCINKDNMYVSRTFVFGQNDDIVRRLDEILGNIYALNNLYEINSAVTEKFRGQNNIELADENGDNYILEINELIEYIGYLKGENQDYSFNMSILSYPKNNNILNTLRIEEPFFWLLNKMEIIKSGNLNTNNANQKQPGILRRLFGGGKS